MPFGSWLYLGPWLAWVVLGLILGPFLVVLIDRLPRRHRPNYSVVRWPVHCARCGTPVSALHLSALVCYLSGQAKCESCGRRAPRRNLLVELAAAVVFGALYFRFGLTLPLLIYSLYACAFIVVFVIDWEHHLIPNIITYPGIILGSLLGFVVPGLGGGLGLLGGLFYGGMFLAFYLLALLIYRQGGAFGLGDVKLALLIGLITGLHGAVVAALLGTLIGGFLAVGLLLSRRASSKMAMAYGPALALGALVTILWSPWIG